jgi:alpha-L-rhamnosidase
VRDLSDAQNFDSRNRDADGAMPDTCPFYSTSATELEADPGWGIAAWVVPAQFSSYYDDDRLERAFYPHQRSYLEHWIALAQKNNVTRGELPPGLQHSGDWGCMQPGPTNCAPVEYSHFFYVTALALQAECATRLGVASDVARYRSLLKDARYLYISKYFESASGCFGNCSDISQIFGLTLAAKADALLSKDEEARAWAQALAWFGEGGKYKGRFGGGIVSLKLLYPLLDAHGMSDLGLKFQLHTDKAPSFGYWIAQGATTLFEYWGNAEYSTPNLLNSYNHIMYGGTGSWYYSTLAGLRRAPGSRSWRDLIIAPPAPGTLSSLTWVNSSIDTPMGLVRSSWSATQKGRFTLRAIVPPNAQARIVMPTVNGDGQTAVVSEGESAAVVWKDGGFVAGACDGIRSASASADGQSVVLTVGSGSYSFASSENRSGVFFANQRL